MMENPMFIALFYMVYLGPCPTRNLGNQLQLCCTTAMEAGVGNRCDSKKRITGRHFDTLLAPMLMLEKPGIFFVFIHPICVRSGSTSNQHRGETARPSKSLRRVHGESAGEPA